MFDTISIGSSIVDIVLQSNDWEASSAGEKQLLTYGEKVSLDDFHIYSGGGASNTAVAFARLGLHSAVLSETGRDEFSSLVLRDFENESVSTQLLIQEKLERTGGAVALVAKGGERVILTYRGAASQLDPYDIPAFWLSQATWVHLSSINGNLATLQKIFKVLQAAQSTKLSWNPGNAELALLAKGQFSLAEIPCEIFFVNQEEWQLLHSVQKEILANIPQVVITQGKAGGDVYLFSQHAFHYEGQQVRALDATGAGDAFAAGYIAATILGLEVQQAIAWGVKNASSVIAFFGAKTGLLYRNQIEEVTQG
jgi:ribokinase